MKLSSLQKIEDYYLEKGLKGSDLREALDNDKKYQELLNKRKTQISNKYSISSSDEQKYTLPTQSDYEILSKVEQLENKNLDDEDKETLELIKAQLEAEWRKPLLNKLNKLLKKYEG